MRVLILHDELSTESSVDAADALEQAAVFSDRFRTLGHDVRTVGVSLDLRAAADEIEHADLVVNLVESLRGRGSLIHVVPALVESLGVPMTGCSASAIAATSNKLSAKRVLHTAGIATPEWFDGSGKPPLHGTWIIKSVWEHASIGLGPSSIVDADHVDLVQRVANAEPTHAAPFFAERYIDGREFNLSILEFDGGPRVLPHAEIRFVDFPDDRPRIVDYVAKWDPEAPEYHNTPRRFEFTAADKPLLDELERVALRCWDAFELRGYARVDFRVDERGRPFVLEINANPCVSPDAGFLAAAERAGLTAAEVIDAIAAAARRRTERACSASAN
ncbi:MAG: D-alanine--D-alanine ligase family protein [Phycisphaerales bacterium]